MRSVRSLALAGALAAGLACPAPAQDDGPGLIGRQIESALSGPGRTATVRGFEGALTGRATMQELTLADADGVWLTLRGAVLDWNRAALLRGRLSVNELSAVEIILDRAPLPAPAEPGLPEPPAAEASGFALPELPVAVNVGRFAIGQVLLGEDFLGEEATFRVNGGVRLEGGEGEVALSLSRTGGPEDRVSLDASFDNESRVLALDLTVREGPDGIASALLNIPGAPSLALDIDGTGPLNDYTANIDLRTQGVQRIGGAVTLRGVEDDDLAFAADIGGDITPVIAPQFADFFGSEVRLIADGTRAADGAFTLDQLDLTARSLSLTGAAALDAEGMPIRFDLSGRLADPEGAPVRLPAGGADNPGINLDTVDVAARFDRAEGDGWSLDLGAQGFAMPDVSIETITLQGGGVIALEDGPPRVTAGLDYAARGVGLAEAALAEAVGEELSGRADLSWQRGAPLTLSGLTLGGADYGVSVAGDAVIAERTLQIDGAVDVSAADLSRFSALAGQDLTGTADIRLDGEGDVLGGTFDASLDLTGTGLAIGQEIPDRFLEGPVTLSAAARRDMSGTFLDRFTLDSTGIEASGSGQVGSGVSDLALAATVKDVGLIRPDLEGALTLDGTAAEREAGLWEVGVDLEGPYGLAGAVAGFVGNGESDIGLDLSLPDIAPLVPQYTGPIRVSGTAAEAGSGVWAVDLDAEVPYDGTLAVAGDVGGGQSDVTLRIALPDIAPIVPQYTGAIEVSGRAAEAAPGTWSVDLDAAAPYRTTLAVAGIVGGGAGDVRLQADVPDVAAFVPGVPGAVSLTGTAQEQSDGLWQVNLDSRLPYDATAAVQGRVGAAGSALSYSARVPDVAAIVPQITGALAATGTAQQTPENRWEIAADLRGPYSSTVNARALVGPGTSGDGQTEAEVALSIPSITPLVPTLRGGIEARATAAQQDSGAWEVLVDADGPYASTIDASGTVGGGGTNARATVSLPDISPLAPRYAGAIRLEATATQPQGAPIAVDATVAAPYGISAEASGQIGMGQGEVRLTAGIPNISPFVPGLSGGITLAGSATEGSNGWAVDLTTNGPGAATTAVNGTVAPDGATANLNATGSVPLELANGILAPQRIAGTLGFDLALNGAPGLPALSGTISTSGAQFDLTSLDQSFEGIDLNVGLTGGAAQIDASARSAAGGGLTVSGPVQLTAPFPGDITVSLNGLVLEDPSLFQTSLGGSITASGPLTGGGALSGRIDIGRTELRIPSGGVGFGSNIPQISHIAEPGTVLATRQRAGLVVEDDEAPGPPPPPFALDLVINAPQEIFIRGRGLDAELGGRIAIGGTTAAIAPVGGIEIIRGRLDLLGNRLDLDRDGIVTLGGDLVPFLDLLATSTRDDFTFLIGITGPVNDPEFSFTSSPQLPEDEVLARFLFGKSVSNLSPVQAVQLASSIATLTGRGGLGVTGRLRQGLGVDDLSIVTTDDGDAAVQVGQYLTENIYTDVTTSSGGNTEVNINIDLTRDVTVKGSADNEGETTLGIFFQRDY